MSPRLIAYGLAGIAILAVLWWAQARIRVSYQAEQERDQAVAAHQVYKRAVEEQARRDAEQRAKDSAADQALAARLNTLQAEKDALARALRRARSTVEKPHADGRTCPVISHDWGVCFAATLGRDPADVAACKAGSGNGFMQDPSGN